LFDTNCNYAMIRALDRHGQGRSSRARRPPAPPKAAQSCAEALERPKKKAHGQVRLNGSFAASPPPLQALRIPDLAGRTALW
jgi:hypothetical protein